MRRLFWIALALALCLMAGCARAEQVTALPGDTVTLTVTCSSSDAVMAIIGFTFDRDALDFSFSGGGMADVIPSAAEERFGLLSYAGGPGNGLLAPIPGGVVGTLTFLVRPQALPGVYTVTPQVTAMNAAGGFTALPVAIDQVEVLPPPTQAPGPVGDVDGDGMVTFRDAYAIFLYSIRALAGEEAAMVEALGDIDGSGEVNFLDAYTLFLRVL